MTEPTPHASPDVLDTGAAGALAIRGGAFRTVGYLVALLLSLASVPFMTRHLGEADFGRYSVVSAIVFVIGGVTEAGLTNLGVREYTVRQGDERSRFLANLVGLRFALTMAGVLLAAAIVAASGQETVLVVGTLVAGAGLFLALVQQTYAVPLTAQLRLGWVTMLDLIRQSTLALAIILLVLAGAGLLPFFGAAVLAGVVMLVPTLALVRHEASLRPGFDLEEWRAIMRQTLSYAAAAAVGLIYFRLALILMSYLSTDTETGLYGAAFRIVEVVGVIPWLVVSAAFPILARAARDDTERLRYALQRLLDTSLLLGIGLAGAIAVGAGFAIEVVGGDEYVGSVPVLRIQGLALLTSFLVATWAFALLSLGLHRALLIANAIAAAVAIAASVALVPALDAEGAALATVGAEASLALAYLVALRRARPDLQPSLGNLPRVLAAAAVAAPAALLVPAHDIVQVTVGGIAFIGASFVLGAIPHELVAALRGQEPAT